MKIFIVSLIAILLIGCSALPSLFDKAESDPVVSEPEPTPVHESETQKPTPHSEVVKPAIRKFHTPLEAKELTRPCRNISDENLYQEIRLKLTCVEEALK